MPCLAARALGGESHEDLSVGSPKASVNLLPVVLPENPVARNPGVQLVKNHSDFIYLVPV